MTPEPRAIQQTGPQHKPPIAPDCALAIMDPLATPAPWKLANAPPATGPLELRPTAHRHKAQQL